MLKNHRQQMLGDFNREIDTLRRQARQSNLSRGTRKLIGMRLSRLEQEQEYLKRRSGLAGE
jgi:hypothetical protein